MATDEASFKLEFKKDVREYLSGNCLVWSSSDRFTSGLPDFFILDRGHFVAVEAKFVKELPKRKSSKVLSHEVSPAQKLFLERVQANGQTGLIALGTPQALIVFERIELNYTLEDCLSAKKFLKIGGKWDLGGLCDFWK